MSVQCKEEIMDGWHFRGCSRKAKKDGYCTQHHPDTIAKRDKDRAARDKIEQENSIYARHKRSQAKLTAIKAACQDCRDGYAPDHPPHDINVLLEAIEDEL